MNISPPKNTCCGAVFLHGTHETHCARSNGQIWQIVPWVNRDPNRGKRVVHRCTGGGEAAYADFSRELTGLPSLDPSGAIVRSLLVQSFLRKPRDATVATGDGRRNRPAMSPVRQQANMRRSVATCVQPSNPGQYGISFSGSVLLSREGSLRLHGPVAVRGSQR